MSRKSGHDVDSQRCRRESQSDYDKERVTIRKQNPFYLKETTETGRRQNPSRILGYGDFNPYKS